MLAGLFMWAEIRTVQKDLFTLHIQYEWFSLAWDRTGWRQLIALVHT